MVNGSGSRYYRALESVSVASALTSTLTIYPCQIRVHQRWQSKLQLLTVTVYPRRLPVNTVIHTTLAGIEPTTFRLFVRRATSRAGFRLTTQRQPAYHMQTIYPDACSRVWTRATVLDGHGGVCITTYRQMSHLRSAQHTRTPSDRDILFCCSSTGLESLADWHSTALTISTFKRHLKTYLFMTAYSC